ncbi:MAG: hypothetical protein WD749_00205 [Phycisphaerales bacterium]
MLVSLIAVLVLCAWGALLFPAIGAEPAAITMAEFCFASIAQFDHTSPVHPLIALSLGAAVLAFIVAPDQRSFGCLLVVLILVTFSFWFHPDERVRAANMSTARSGVIIGLVLSLLLALSGPMTTGLRGPLWWLLIGGAVFGLFSLYTLRLHERAGNVGELGFPMAFASYGSARATLSLTMMGANAAVWGVGLALLSVVFGSLAPRREALLVSKDAMPKAPKSQTGRLTW